MMGYRSGLICHQDQQQAIDAHFSSIPASLVSGLTSHISYFEKVGGVWKLHKQVIDPNGVVLNQIIDASLPELPSCEPFGLQDDLTMAFSAGFIIPMGAFVISYVIGQMLEMFSD